MCNNGIGNIMLHSNPNNKQFNISLHTSKKIKLLRNNKLLRQMTRVAVQFFEFFEFLKYIMIKKFQIKLIRIDQFSSIITKHHHS